MMNASKPAAILFVFTLATCILAQADELALSLQSCEQKAVAYSWRLKAAESDVNSASEQLKAGYALLFPRLSLQANYTFLSTLPELSVGAPGSTPITFGSHHNFTLGPVLNYTLWDTFSSLNTYKSFAKIEEAKKEDQRNSKNQLLFSVRSAYVAAQLAEQELRLVNHSLKLAKSQERDIQNRENAGASSKLDLIMAKRHVLGFQLKLQSQQAVLALAMKDLQALIGQDAAFELDPLAVTLAVLSQVTVLAPGEDQPQIKKQELLAQSSELAATAQKAKLFPSLQLTASTTVAYPNGPQIEVFNQNTIGLMLSMPLYLGDPTLHLTEQKRSEARSARYMGRQIKSDLERDYKKAQDTLESLKKQKVLADEDANEAFEIANLYYGSYKEGKSKLIDVQSANNETLLAKVGQARIEAQIAQQLVMLMALYGQGSEL